MDDNSLVIVCRDEQHAKRVRRWMKSSSESVQAISATSPMQFRALAPKRIVVSEGVNLQACVENIPLGAFLRDRQTVWGDRAEFIEL